MAASPKRQDDRAEEQREDEAGRWVRQLVDERYALLAPKGKHEGKEERKPERAAAKEERTDAKEEHRPVLAEPAKTHWLDLRKERSLRILQDRKAHPHRTHKAGEEPQPGVPGSNNWVTIGPSVLRRGQATGSPAVAGRVSRVAIAPGGTRIYAASADGGLWRSDDAGVSWHSSMDGFDLDPTSPASTSLTCGALASADVDAVGVVGVDGEGDVDELFNRSRVTALPCYRGIGPVRSDNGGGSWAVEPTAPGSPTLAGIAFFDLAVDPGDRDNVVAATTQGLYRREADGSGGYHWVRKRSPKHTSVVACRVGMATTFFAAQWGGGVYSSPDGDTWTAVGTGFPAGAGRVALAARPTDPGVLYAFNATTGGSFQGLYRLDGQTGPWRPVGSLPSLGGQADYNLAVTVDPNNANIVYLAGQAAGGDGSIYRCAVSGAGSPPAYSMATTFIGQGVHADVHALAHAPGSSTALWAACDGGMFLTTTATGTASFKPRNTGMATLCGNAFSQHPTQPAVIILGLQDNGTARYTGEEAWLRIRGGDGGYPVINWADPTKVLVYANGSVSRSTDGGLGSFGSTFSPPWAVMAEPVVTTPYRPASPADAEYVAFGAGTRLYISTDFGLTWPAVGSPTATLPEFIYALAFVSTSRLYLGTTGGQVHRFDRSGTTWTGTRIDNALGGALPVAGLVTDIEVDPADATGNSVYVTFGGIGDPRHVWHFDGTQWQSRSGTGGTALLDNAHNAIVADPLNPATLYAASDVGVWRSTDSGATWTPMQSGLPDAPVFDLQLHPTARLLRASTHGRGMFEFKVDGPAQPDVELYARDTSLDVARGNTVDGLPDPETWPVQAVRHYLAHNIKVDVPTPAGYQTPTSAIDFLAFNDIIVDGSHQVATLDPADGTVVNRVYVEVHNRGIVPAATVRVMLVMTDASMGLPPLPAGYQANVQSGTPISTSAWQTVGTVTLSNLRAGFPQVAAFALPSTMLPPPASLPGQSHHCLVALLHSPQDPFSSSQTNVDLLTIADRKVAQQNLGLATFVGTPPPPGAEAGMWAAIDLHGQEAREGKRAHDIILDARGFRGALGIVLPRDLKFQVAAGLGGESDKGFVERWATRHLERLREWARKGRYRASGCRQMAADIRRVADCTILMAEQGKRRTYSVSGIEPAPGRRYRLFVYLEPSQIKPGETQWLHVVQRDSRTKRVEGGASYQVRLVADQVELRQRAPARHESHELEPAAT